jgi:uncharacterized membrane protein
LIKICDVCWLRRLWAGLDTFRRDDSGSIMLDVTIFIITLMALVAVNGARLMLLNGDLQEIADAGALAGADELDGQRNKLGVRAALRATEGLIDPQGGYGHNPHEQPSFWAAVQEESCSLKTADEVTNYADPGNNAGGVKTGVNVGFDDP